MGEMQVLEACKFLKEIGSSPTVVRYSLAAASVDSANIIGDELKVIGDEFLSIFNTRIAPFLLILLFDRHVRDHRLGATDSCLSSITWIHVPSGVGTLLQ